MSPIDVLAHVMPSGTYNYTNACMLRTLYMENGSALI